MPQTAKKRRSFPFLLLSILILTLACFMNAEIKRADSQPMAQAASPHQVGGKFRNPYLPPRSRWGDFWRWRLGLGPQEEPALPSGEVPPYRPEIVAPDQNYLNHADPQTIQLTWLGHATFLIQVAGLNILTDPMFSERASPVSFAGPKRVAPLPLHPAELPPIHAVVISHNHYDHLDKASIATLSASVDYFVPLGLAVWFQRLGRHRVQEMDWWQTTDYGPIRVHCVPSQHFSMRTPFDANRSLWAGWVLETPSGTIFFAGDTGYTPQFQEIGRRFGPMRLALIPIGGYRPRWFMRPMHLDPVEAVQVHREVMAQQSIGMHWGTFKLTDEPLAEPPLYLHQVLRQSQLPPEQFQVMRIGETKIFTQGKLAWPTDRKPAAARERGTETKAKPGVIPTN